MSQIGSCVASIIARETCASVGTTKPALSITTVAASIVLSTSSAEKPSSIGLLKMPSPHCTPCATNCGGSSVTSRWTSAIVYAPTANAHFSSSLNAVRAHPCSMNAASVISLVNASRHGAATNERVERRDASANAAADGGGAAAIAASLVAVGAAAAAAAEDGGSSVVVSAGADARRSGDCATSGGNSVQRGTSGGPASAVRSVARRIVELRSSFFSAWRSDLESI